MPRIEKEVKMKHSILKGGGFILRHATMKDSQDYFEIHKDKEAKKNFMHVPKNLKEAKKELAGSLRKMNTKKPTEEMFAVEQNGKVIGFVWLTDIDYGYLKHKAGVGYGLKKEARKIPNAILKESLQSSKLPKLDLRLIIKRFNKFKREELK